MKYFFDLWYLSRTFPFDGGELVAALTRTFMRPEMPLPAAVPTGLTAEFAALPRGRPLCFKRCAPSRFRRCAPRRPRRPSCSGGLRRKTGVRRDDLPRSTSTLVLSTWQGQNWALPWSHLESAQLVGSDLPMSYRCKAPPEAPFITEIVVEAITA